MEQPVAAIEASVSELPAEDPQAPLGGGFCGLADETSVYIIVQLTWPSAFEPSGVGEQWYQCFPSGLGCRYGELWSDEGEFARNLGFRAVNWYGSPDEGDPYCTLTHQRQDRGRTITNYELVAVPGRLGQHERVRWKSNQRSRGHTAPGLGGVPCAPGCRLLTTGGPAFCRHPGSCARGKPSSRDPILVLFVAARHNASGDLLERRVRPSLGPLPATCMGSRFSGWLRLATPVGT